MKVAVDPDRCESHGRCMETAPQVFEVGDDDKMHILMPAPPPELRPQIEAAVAGCPKQALSLIEP